MWECPKRHKASSCSLMFSSSWKIRLLKGWKRVLWFSDLTWKIAIFSLNDFFMLSSHWIKVRWSKYDLIVFGVVYTLRNICEIQLRCVRRPQNPWNVLVLFAFFFGLKNLSTEKVEKRFVLFRPVSDHLHRDWYPEQQNKVRKNHPIS